EVSAGLSSFHHSECVFLPRYGKTDGIIARDLEEDSGVRATLVCLTGRVQEARTESEASRDVLVVAYSVPESLQDRFLLLVHLNESEQGEIISRGKTIEMRTQVAGERPMVAHGLRQHVRIP